MHETVISFSIEQAVVVGMITGIFSAGTIYGILKTELKNLREDVDKIEHDVKKLFMKGPGQ